MQIIIDIPEDEYEYIKEYGLFGYGVPSTKCSVEDAIKNGTVLPKHGRLIDADELIEVTECMYLEGDGPISYRVDGNTGDSLIGKFQMVDTILDAPTILEANNETKEKE